MVAASRCDGLLKIGSPRSYYLKYYRFLKALNVVTRTEIPIRPFLTQFELGHTIEISLRKEVVQEHE